MTNHIAEAIAQLEVAEVVGEGLLADDIRYTRTTLVLATGRIAADTPLAVSSAHEHLLAAAAALDAGVTAGETAAADVLTARSELAALLLRAQERDA